MKKAIVLILIAALLFGIVGCSNKQDKSETLSFSGQHEYFFVSNCSVTVGADEDVFEGGELEIIRDDMFTDIVSYSTSFYVLRNGEKRVVLSGSVVNESGDPLSINRALGKVSGNSIFIGHKVNNVEELIENLWFELKTIDTVGKENVYQIQLILSK